MNEIIDAFISNLTPVLVTFITAVLGYIGMSIKKIISDKVNKEQIENIINQTVKYVEQITKDSSLSSAEKFNEAKDKASAWLKEKGLKVSDVELEIMIECAVNCLHNTTQD